MRILVVNAGSSSLKLRVLDPDDTVAASKDHPAPGDRADDAIGRYVRDLPRSTRSAIASSMVGRRSGSPWWSPATSKTGSGP
jgi:hypothetical protein